MDIAFEPAKDASNLAKHGVSLAAAADLAIVAVVPDDWFGGEQRYRIYGLLDGIPHCLAAVLRDGTVRAISFRRAHSKEYNRHA